MTKALEHNAGGAMIDARYGYVFTSMDSLGDRNTLIDRFREVEQGGAEAIWFSDHLYSGYPSADPFVLAGLAAAATEHCVIGTGILQVPLRRPSTIAKGAATVQMIAQGRFVLGVGVGQHAREFEAVGADFARRGATTDATLAALDDLWSDREGWFAQRPVPQPIPITVGGHSDAALRRTARFGTGWMPLFLSPRRFAERSQVLDEVLAAADREPSQVIRRVTLLVGTTGDGWSADDVLAFAGRLFPGGAAGLEHHVITGTAEECVEQIRRFESHGAESIELCPVRPDGPEMFTELVTRLRAR